MKSAKTNAIMASPTGTARIPTQGSWRPLVIISQLLPLISIVLRGIKIELVGFTAKRTTKSCPEEIPPITPPELLEEKLILPFSLCLRKFLFKQYKVFDYIKIVVCVQQKAQTYLHLPFTYNVTLR